MNAPRCTHPPTGRAARAATAYRAPLPVLTTARLTLRAPRMEDLGAWTRIYLESFDEAGGGAAAAWTEFGYYTAGWLLHGHGLWSVERTDDATLLGFVLLGLEWGDAEPELGWMFLPEHRGEGYATEAAEAAQAHGFALLGTGRFVSYVDRGNTASAALAQRLGAHRDAQAEKGLGAGMQVWRHGGAA